MSFQAVVPSGGIVGWRFLQRTYEAQLETYSAAPQIERDSAYFREKIGAVTSAADLVADRRLLGVALGAFGLQGDLSNRFFIQKILEDGTTDTGALANRLADNRYERLSRAFGFGPGEIRRTGDEPQMAEVARLNAIQEFEISVGQSDDTLRVALYAQRELAGLAASGASDETKWFTIMGLPPLRSMFETALGLPTAFGQIDLDKQLEIFRDKTLSMTGSSGIDQFANPEAMETLTNRYLARSQIQSGAAALSSGATALTLLRAL